MTPQTPKEYVHVLNTATGEVRRLNLAVPSQRKTLARWARKANPEKPTRGLWQLTADPSGPLR